MSLISIRPRQVLRNLAASRNLQLAPSHKMTTASFQNPPQKASDAAGIPPGYKAQVGSLQTFVLPDIVTGSEDDKKLGEDIVEALQRDGILQITMKAHQQAICKAANEASRHFFKKPHAQKAACIDSQTYAGYIASGEELTDGIADYSEIFTITKDLGLDDPRVLEKWPCHGRCPWPDADLQRPIKQYMDSLGESGETLLKLTELGLHVPEGSLTHLTRDGWHHLRMLRWVA